MGTNPEFRKEYKKWKVLESSTLRILGSSSRKREAVEPERVLAVFTFYNLIGKLLFYLTLCENLSGELSQIDIDDTADAKTLLNKHFDEAGKIDYQAIFRPYFTDGLGYSPVTNKAIFALLKVLTSFDFRILPAGVIGHILENLVPANEKQKLGQYFTNELLAYLVAYPVVKTKDDILFDPTCGTGTFLNAFYKILRFFGSKEHAGILEQIWGNDISHFPAILSVINLYKEDVTATDNFPRVTREDFFNMEVGKKVAFPDAHNHNKHNDVAVPLYDGIASNFPFIQQEDIPNDKLSAFFRQQFQDEQQAFLKDNTFRINERSDYFTYCVYHSTRFLKPDGCLAAITSNAWLGKEYGLQFKKFLLDNFHIRYIVRSVAEHWFRDSQVSTIYCVLEKSHYDEPTRFITVNKKLHELFNSETAGNRIQQIEDFYADVDNCNDCRNTSWEEDKSFTGLYKRKDGQVSVCLVSKDVLSDSVRQKSNWKQYFISADLFGSLNKHFVQYYPTVVKVFRGERTGWNPMFVIKTKDIKASRISTKYLKPYIKSSAELTRIEFAKNYEHRVFVCRDALSDIDKGTKNWISKYANMYNKNGSKTVPEACAAHRPYWYSINPKQANIITTINPYERFFFTFSKEPFVIDQRLIALQTQKGYDVELIAALLNSVITFLLLEFKGTSRSLGALDLNADYLKQIHLLNPDILTDEQHVLIKKAFEPLKHRDIESIFDEVKREDRRHFDETIFECYGLNKDSLDDIYSLLTTSVEERITLKKK